MLCWISAAELNGEAVIATRFLDAIENERSIFRRVDEHPSRSAPCGWASSGPPARVTGNRLARTPVRRGPSGSHRPCAKPVPPVRVAVLGLRAEMPSPELSERVTPVCQARTCRLWTMTGMTRWMQRAVAPSRKLSCCSWGGCAQNALRCNEPAMPVEVLGFPLIRNRSES
jgi:hypothetical protein